MSADERREEGSEMTTTEERERLFQLAEAGKLNISDLRPSIQEEGRRRTDEEVRERIAEHQKAIEWEEERGREGGMGWLLTATKMDELRWVLGE